MSGPKHGVRAGAQHARGVSRARPHSGLHWGADQSGRSDSAEHSPLPFGVETGSGANQSAAA